MRNYATPLRLTDAEAAGALAKNFANSASHKHSTTANCVLVYSHRSVCRSMLILDLKKRLSGGVALEYILQQEQSTDHNAPIEQNNLLMTL